MGGGGGGGCVGGGGGVSIGNVPATSLLTKRETHLGLAIVRLSTLILFSSLPYWVKTVFGSRGYAPNPRWRAYNALRPQQ